MVSLYMHSLHNVIIHITYLVAVDVITNAVSLAERLPVNEEYEVGSYWNRNTRVQLVHYTTVTILTGCLGKMLIPAISRLITEYFFMILLGMSSFNFLMID